jgi:hypothetical protein
VVTEPEADVPVGTAEAEDAAIERQKLDRTEPQESPAVSETHEGRGAMEFRIAKAEFLRGLRPAQGIADRESTMPMLANVVLRTQARTSCWSPRPT